MNDRAADHPPDGTVVNVTGVSVLAIDVFDETADGASAGNLYAQDLPVGGATPPYGGHHALQFELQSAHAARRGPVTWSTSGVPTTSSKGPRPAPSLRRPPGPRVLRVAARIVGGTLKLRFEYSVPEPVVIPLADLASYETGRKWIGMLVRVENVKAQSAGFKANTGRYSVRPGRADQRSEDAAHHQQRAARSRRHPAAPSTRTRPTSRSPASFNTSIISRFRPARRTTSSCDLSAGAHGGRAHRARAHPRLPTRRHPAERDVVLGEGGGARRWSPGRGGSPGREPRAPARAIPPAPWRWRWLTTSDPRRRWGCRRSSPSAWPAAAFARFVAQAHGLGLHLSTLVASPADAARFVRAATAAITTAIAPGQRPPSEQRAPTLRGPAEAAVHACSGELGLEPNAGSGPMEPPDGSTLESWRGQAASAGTVAFAAVGTRPLLDALANAVATGDKWTSPSAPPTMPGPRPTASGAFAPPSDGCPSPTESPMPLGPSRRATSCAGPGSVLAARLSALDGAYSLDCVVATSRVRGACLRIDVRAGFRRDLTARSWLARSASWTTRPAARSRAGSVSRARSTTRWSAPPTPPTPQPPPHGARSSASSLEAPHGAPCRGRARPRAANAKSSERRWPSTAARQASSVERRLRVEAGQGELWALVASPCGTASESSDDAGVHDVLARVLAKKRSAISGVRTRTLGDAGLGGPPRPRLALEPRRDARRAGTPRRRRAGARVGRHADRKQRRGRNEERSPR